MNPAKTPSSSMPSGLSRRRLASWAVGACLPGWVFAQSAAKKSAPLVQVWKDPNCGCCKDWVTHLERSGFRTQLFETGNNAVRSRLGLPQRYASCHTALVDGYVIEGHVPASDIRKLAQKPQLAGLAVPGMPAGSPGMEMGDRQDAYQVIGLDRQGQEQVVSSYPGN